MQFSFRRSVRPALVLAALLMGLTGCRLLIPEEQNAPRYNTVLGDKRVPERNRETPIGPDSSAEPFAPVRISAAMEHPETAPATSAPGDERSVWDRMAFWREDTMAQGARQVPVENTNELAAIAPSYGVNTVASSTSQADGISYAPPQGAFQVAAVGYPTSNPESYPQLSAVPLRPDSDAARLNAVRAQLERDRMNAGQSAANLSAAAAAEPPILSPIPEPVAVTNLPPPPAPAAPIYQAPVAPPTPLASPPIVAAPVALQPPAPAPAATPVMQYGVAPQPVQSMRPAARGGFDPMAGGYLPESRYAR